MHYLSNSFINPFFKKKKKRKGKKVRFTAVRVTEA